MQFLDIKGTTEWGNEGSNGVTIKHAVNYWNEDSDHVNSHSEVVATEEETHMLVSKDVFYQEENPDYDPENPDSQQYIEMLGSKECQISVSPDSIEFSKLNEETGEDIVVDPFELTPVSGTNDGSNWTSLTIGSDTYSIPSGGNTAWGSITGTLSNQSDLMSKFSDYATVSDVTALSSVYAPLSDYASQSWVSANFLSSGYVPTISGYAELSRANTFTGVNTFYGGTSMFLSQTDLRLKQNANGLKGSTIYFDNTMAGSGVATIRLTSGSTPNFLITNIYGQLQLTGATNARLVADNGSLYLTAPSGAIVASTSTGSAIMNIETWTFTLSDNTTVTKTILVG